jgi:hypothetical protein
MKTALVLRPSNGPLIGGSRDLSIDQLLAAFFKGRRPNTLRSYRLDLEDFARFLARAGSGFRAGPVSRRRFACF